MPYPARLNPNVDSTRAHTKAWAIGMGMIGAHGTEGQSFVWTEAEFDAHEFALLCAYTQPELPPIELDLMADWYVWLFFFDDYYSAVIKHDNDIAGGRRLLARLWDFLPLEPGPVPAIPSNPIERGMAQLWTRTVIGSTPEWRRRYLDHVKDMLETAKWEHYNIRHNRVANPLEYVAMRRMVGGCVWAACLIERAHGLRLPDSVLAARPVRIIHEAFADCEHFHNDLMSYSREVRHERENANCVLVFERFLAIDPQHAANVSTDLISARLHQFEHTVLTELPVLFDELCLPPQQRVDVLRYAKGVLDWISGAYDWHFQSSRYDSIRGDHPAGLHGGADYIGPTGLAAAGARVLASLGFRTHTQALGPSSSPFTFYMPFPARRHTAVVELRVHTRAWATSMGLFDAGVWTPASFERDDVPLRAACCQPDVNLSTLALSSDWCTWASFVVDYASERFERARDLRGATIFAQQLCHFVASDPPTREPGNPAERALADLWHRHATSMSPTLREAFATRVRAHVESLVWKVGNATHDRPPDLIDYCEMRRAGELSLMLVRLADEVPLPPEVLDDRLVAQLCDAFCDVNLLRDDIEWSRAASADDETFNAVLILERLFDCSRPQAIASANALMTSRIEQFEHIATHYLPELFDELDLDEASRSSVRAWVGRLEAWMAGELEWSRVTERYAGELARRRGPDGPTDSMLARDFLGRTSAIYDIIGIPPQDPRARMVRDALADLDRRSAS
jgi:germacradienol/geosmin synthase